MKLRLLSGLGLGAAFMYVFDPQQGRRRRALARDKALRARHKLADAVGTTSRDLKNRAQGLAAEARSLLSREQPRDEVLAYRVRSKLGFLVSHPSAIDVDVQDGTVILSGPVLKHEVDRLLKGVGAMRGVKKVDNRLEAHESAGGVPGLQGAARQPVGERPDILQTQWSPATRLLTGAAAGGVVLFGRRFGSVIGSASAVLGAGLLARALTNMELRRLVGVGAGRRAIDVHKTINVAAPVENVFEFWSDYENFPRFMRNVREVKDIGNNRSHWVAAGPAGVPVEWDAELTTYIPNREIAWKTVPGSAIEHAGRILFHGNRDGTTRLDIRMSYNPVAGALGHTLAAIFGADPKSEMDEDLARLKTTLETGKPPHDAARAAELGKQG
ncbi:MAG: SRPBCC family protein [Candidatus Binatia bacterium]